MPWDGALPMLRHGRLQLKVIAFPVPPPLFVPPFHSSLLPFLAFSSSQSAVSLLPQAGPLLSYSFLAFYRPPLLCLTLALSCLCRNLLREMAKVQQRRF